MGALIEQRLQRLSEPALTLARVAAIAGVDFCIELAEWAIGHRAVQLASAWRELQDAQVLRDEALAHDLVADAVLRGLPPVVARRVPAQCAQWLAQRGGEPARIARHWLDGGQPQAGALAFEEAARRAQVAARQGEEAQLYALAAQAYGAAGSTQARFEALASHVAALIAARADDTALHEARALVEHAASDAQRAHALCILADMTARRGELEESLTLAHEGMALAKCFGDQAQLVRLTCIAAANYCKTGRGPRAYALMLPLRDWVDAQAGDTLRTQWYGDWAGVLGHVGPLRESVDSHVVVIARAERAGDQPVAMMAWLNQSIMLRNMGALERAFEASQRGLALASVETANAEHQLAQLIHTRNQAETGRFASATPAFESLVTFFETMGAPFWVHATRAAQARLWQHLGQYARALQALDLDDSGQPAWVQADRLWLRLEVQQWLGQPTAAEPAQQALALMEADGNRRTANIVRGLRFAPPQAVLGQATSPADSARSLELFGTLAALRLHQARAAMALQQPSLASDAARALVALLQEGYVPDSVYLPEAWLVAGQALQAAGDAPAALAAWAAGQSWVRERALPQVPPPSIDSFLHRNPVNQQLLALAALPP